jgi:D-alanyl-D-alanine endopeptidase (penicillin-binding protein 7)
MAGRYSKISWVIVLSIFFLLFSYNDGFSKSSKKRHHHRKQSISQSVKNKGGLVLGSAAIYVKDQQTGKCLIQKQAKAVMPIASITKLMTAMVVLDAELDLGEDLNIEMEDVYAVRGTSSRLAAGTELTRKEALLLALMSSDNRCAHALGRTYPGGYQECVRAMNAKARLLGLMDTRFQDTIGLSSGNVSSARDLAILVDQAYQYDLIRDFSTRKSTTIFIDWQMMSFRNTNKLVRDSDWKIGLSKTGFTREAGKCLVMQAKVAKRPLLIVLLDSRNSRSRISDANRIKMWLESRPRSERT